MNIDFSRKLISDPSEQTIKQLFDGNIDGVFWVDWREADEVIIDLAAKRIGGGKLKPEWHDGKLSIRFCGKLTEVPLKFEPGEQYITLATLHEALYPEYEIRYIKASEGGDTIAFMILKRQTLSELEIEFQEKVAVALQKVERGSRFFNQAAQEQIEMKAAKLAKERKFARSTETPPASFWNDQELVSLGVQHLSIKHSAPTINKVDRRYYCTSLTNVSEKSVRVKRFAAFAENNGDYILSTVTKKWFSASDFVSWYRTGMDGWIRPGETVADGSNFGSSKIGFWAFWCENEDGLHFIAMASFPTDSDIGYDRNRQ